MRAPVMKAMLISVVIAGLPACTDQMQQNDRMPDRTDGEAFYVANCASCHGANGQGGGPDAAGLAKSPTDLTMLARKNGGSFPQARALSYIYGDPGNSHLARVMPQFGGAMAEDLVPLEVEGVLTPTPRELAGLLFYLESIQK